MLSILLAILSALIATIFSLWRFKRRNYFAKSNIPSAVNDSLIFGSTKSSILKRRNILYDIDDVYKSAKKEGNSPIVGFYVFQTPYILLLDANLVKSCRKIRNNDFQLSRTRDPIIALNPFFLKDEEWKQKRKDTDAAVSLSRVSS